MVKLASASAQALFKPHLFPSTMFCERFFGMIDYYVMMEFNFLWFAAVSVVLGVVIGYYHVRRGHRDHLDEVAEELL